MGLARLGSLPFCARLGSLTCGKTPLPQVRAPVDRSRSQQGTAARNQRPAVPFQLPVDRPAFRQQMSRFDSLGTYKELERRIIPVFHHGSMARTEIGRHPGTINRLFLVRSPASMRHDPSLPGPVESRPGSTRLLQQRASHRRPTATYLMRARGVRPCSTRHTDRMNWADNSSPSPGVLEAQWRTCRARRCAKAA